MVLDRIWPPRKGRPIDVAMPPISSSQDLFPAIVSIWTAIRDGRLTPDEASALSIVIDRSIQAVELHDISKRIAALEEAEGETKCEKQSFGGLMHWKLTTALVKRKNNLYY